MHDSRMRSAILSNAVCFKITLHRVLRLSSGRCIMPDDHAGQPGEQWTMFFKDPSGNALEFKAMTTPDNLFAKYYVS